MPETGQWQAARRELPLHVRPALQPPARQALEPAQRQEQARQVHTPALPQVHCLHPAGLSLHPQAAEAAVHTPARQARHTEVQLQATVQAPLRTAQDRPSALQEVHPRTGAHHQAAARHPTAVQAVLHTAEAHPVHHTAEAGAAADLTAAAQAEAAADLTAAAQAGAAAPQAGADQS